MNRYCYHASILPRRGFTLIELVVVVLILGILAAVAGPKMFNAAGDARESSARRNLTVIRDSIELFRAVNGAYPGQSGGETGFKTDIATTIRVPFPTCAVGNQNDNVNISSTNSPLTPSGVQGWHYSKLSGEFIINDAGYSSW